MRTGATWRKFAAFAAKRRLETARIRRADLVDFLASLYTAESSTAVRWRGIWSRIRHFFRFR